MSRGFKLFYCDLGRVDFVLADVPFPVSVLNYFFGLITLAQNDCRHFIITQAISYSESISLL